MILFFTFPAFHEHRFSSCLMVRLPWRTSRFFTAIGRGTPERTFEFEYKAMLQFAIIMSDTYIVCTRCSWAGYVVINRYVVSGAPASM